MTKMLRVLASLLIIFSLMGCGTKKTEEVKENAMGTETETIVKDEVGKESTTDTNLNKEGNQSWQWPMTLRINL